MTDVRRALAAAVLPITLLAGCGDKPADRIDSAEATVTPTDPAETPSTDEPADPLVAAAVTALASRLGVAEADIEVVSREEVAWRDGSLGCPEPDMSYTQALVDGVRIVLRADGEDHAYHSGGGEPAFLCESPTE